MNQEAIAILAGGGPAPGINTVVASVTKVFLRNGYRVIGLNGGYSGLFNPCPSTIEIDWHLADLIFNRGGSYLKMSRFKPSDKNFQEDFNLDFFTKNNIKLMITIGGDDTASTANRIAKFLKEKSYPIKNIHVPKTIDNDLPLPNGAPTFGYNSAMCAGAQIATTVMRDATTSDNWFVVVCMGRTAGHLAFGAGVSSHYPMIIIPEMFNRTQVTVDKILNLVISSIIKRKIMGVNFGAAMISEGVFHNISDEELQASGIRLTYDDHGHPELGKISKSHILAEILDRKLEEIKLGAKIRPEEIGYETRCVDPVGYDLDYCTKLGLGVFTLFKKGETGCMVYVNHLGDVSPLFLEELQDPETGKIPPRQADIEGNHIKTYIFNLMEYLTPADYEAARKFVPNPEEYDFFKILNW